MLRNFSRITQIFGLIAIFFIISSYYLLQDAEAKDLDIEINCINGDLVIIVKDEQGNPLSSVRVGTADYPTRYPSGERWLTDTNGTVTIKSSSNLGYVNFSKGGYNEVFFATPCQIPPTKSSSPEDQNSVSALINKGNAFSELGRHQEAIQSYDQALEIDPNNAVALNNKGFSLTNLGNFKEAISNYERSIEINPTYLTALYNVADALYQEWYCKDAIYYFDRIIEIEPDDPYAFNSKASMLASLGHVDEALSVMDKVLEKDPNYYIYFPSPIFSIDENDWSESYWMNILKKYPNVWNGVSNKTIGLVVAGMEKSEIGTICQKTPFDKLTVSEIDQPKEKIPDWIKNNAKWWAEGVIGEKDFVGGIQFLIKEKIIDIPDLPEQASDVAEEKVPDWIKNNAGWWAKGLISEDDFVNGIKYLVEKGIIVV